MALVFNMGSQARLEQGIEAGDTRILLTSYDTMLSKGGSGDTYYAQMINAIGEKEIVLVDVGNSDSLQGLSVTRGVESTSAQAWGAGTIIWQVMSETSLEPIIQKSVIRQVAYSPDGVLVSDYIGEEVYQSDLHLWWKAVGDASSEWRLIAGEIFTADVVFDPSAGGVALGTSVTMTCATSGAAIYYTLDGSDPDETDTLYTTPVAVPDPGPTTFKAKAYGAERWESPAANITSGVYTIAAQDTWVDKSMSTGPFPRTIYSTGAGALLMAENTVLYERVGTSWSQVRAAYSTTENYYMLEDGAYIYLTCQNNRVVRTDTTSYPAWTVWISPLSTMFGTYLQALHHIFLFGGNIYLGVQSSNISQLDHGLYLMSGQNSVSLYSSFSSGSNDGNKTSPPVECNGYLYGIVRDPVSAWAGNLLRMDSGTATRLTTTDENIYSLFSYNNELYGWGYDGTETYVEVKKFNGSSWVTQKSTYAGTSTRLFFDQTIQVGSVFFIAESANCDLWRWNPVADVLERVAGNITDEYQYYNYYSNQYLAWDPLDSPATMWLTPGQLVTTKTYRWEEL